MKEYNFSFKDYANGLKKAIDLVKNEQVNNLYEVVDSYVGSNNNIFLLGNGGSQANAHHISGDFMKTFSLVGLKFKVSCLADNVCYLTAASNDVSYDEAYSILVNNTIGENDFLVYLSGSGNSLNLVKCARKAKSRKIKQAAITGFNGGALNGIVDYPVNIKFDDMEICEDIQLSIFHYIKQKLILKYSDLFDKCEVPKYFKRTVEDLISWFT